MNRALLDDCRRFFVSLPPDNSRAHALERGDAQAIAGHLLPFVVNGNAAQKRNARALLRRLDNEGVNA